MDIDWFAYSNNNYGHVIFALHLNCTHLIPRDQPLAVPKKCSGGLWDSYYYRVHQYPDHWVKTPGVSEDSDDDFD